MWWWWLPLLVLGAASLGLGVALRRRTRRPALPDGLPLIRIDVDRYQGRLLGGPVTVSASPGRFTFAAEGADPAIAVRRRRADGQSGLATGDAAFDERHAVEGDPIRALALLDDGCRAAFADGRRWHLQVSDGAVRGDCPPEVLEEALSAAAALARRLAPTEEPALQRIVTRYPAEPSVGARVRLLEALRSAGAEGADAALALASRDPSGEARRRAAVWQDDARSLARLSTDPEAPGLTRDQAWLAAKLHPDTLRDALIEALDDPQRARLVLNRIAALDDPALTEAAVRHARAVVDDPVRLEAEGAALLRPFERHPEQAPPEVLLAVALAGSQTVAAAAIGLLRRSGDPGVREGLARVAADRPELAPAALEARSHLDSLGPGRALAESLGLRFDAPRRRVEGTLDGSPIEVSTDTEGARVIFSGQPGTLRLVPRPDRLPPLADTPLHRALRADPPTLPWLVPEVRDRVLAALERCNVVIADGRLVLSGPPASAEALAGWVDAGRAIAAALGRRRDWTPEQRLHAAFAEEPDASVRRALARATLPSGPPPPIEVLDDPDPEVVRITARWHRRGDALERVALDPAAPMEVRRSATQDLQEVGEDPERERVARGALEVPALQAEALQLIDRRRLAALLPAVVALVERAAPAGSPPERLGVEPVPAALRVAAHLAHFDGATCEPVLVRGTASPDPSVRRAVLVALGRIGTGRSVPVLAELARGWGVNPDVTAARAALVLIRERGAEGALSIAAPVGGDVSIVTPGGDLSLGEPDE